MEAEARPPSPPPMSPPPPPADSSTVHGFQEVASAVSSSSSSAAAAAEIAPPPSPPPPPPPPLDRRDQEEANLQAEHFSGAAEEDQEAAPYISCGGGEDGLSDELRDQIVRQVEYYFSDENLPTDKFLLKFVKKDKDGFVPIALIASFRRMKKLVQDLSLIEAALRTSSHLVVSLDGKKVRRLHPLPVDETKDAKLRTVIVENLSEDYSIDSIKQIFGNVGSIVNVTIHVPHSVVGSATAKRPEIVISSKVHVLVEYESVEAAEKAVATLNDEKNWRSGLRVELLSKRMGKHGLYQKVDKGTISKKNNDTQRGEIASEGEKLKPMGRQDETDEDQLAVFKGGRKNRHKGRGRSNVQQNSDGQGHESIPVGSSAQFMSKPIPGPRMPDGTRGFAMGRGKPVNPEHKPGEERE
uniref:La-related protein 6A n=1 Tax=Ananas comosus var. bracteatus TaxID=296719 RepID=A0A6V7PU17_ANACO|nr:unnamed protein product [Ananas comosus var. bracteatus]